MKKSLLSVLAVALFLASCGGKKENSDKVQRLAKGNVYYGGVFRMNEEEDFRNLYPLSVNEAVSFRIAMQVYEGLVKLSSKDLTVVPSLAEKWEVSDDAKTFTFYIRKGVKFHDNECFEGGTGREVTAKDFKYSLDKACESSPNNQGFFVFQNRVTGANEYFESTKLKKPLAGGVSGIKVIDDYTLQISLNYPFAGFINVLTMPYGWVFPKEAVDKYGADMRIKCVGTGPFLPKEVKEGEAVILTRNENYWDKDKHGNQLPYLDAIKVTFIKEKKAELLEFKKGNLEMVYRLPIEMIGDITGEFEEAKKGGNPPFEMQNSQQLSLQYYGFQNLSKPFDNKLVRQAFNYAIDREQIVNFVLQGDGQAAKYGAVPSVLTGYNSDLIKGYEFNADKARQLLAKAGYPNGKGFPELTLDLNSGGGRNTQVAEAVQKMLKENLNIKVNLNQMPLAQHLDKYETGKSLFWRTAWQADYPDPESFLNLFFGENVPASMAENSYVNCVRFKNAQYDTLFKQALHEVDLEKRYALYRKADQLAIDEAAYLPIYYEEISRLIQPYVKNCDQNSLEYRDLTRVYIIPKDKIKIELQKPDSTVTQEDIKSNK